MRPFFTAHLTHVTRSHWCGRSTAVKKTLFQANCCAELHFRVFTARVVSRTGFCFEAEPQLPLLEENLDHAGFCLSVASGRSTWRFWTWLP